MVDRIAVFSAEMAGVTVARQNITAKFLVAVQPSYRVRINDDGGMLPHERNGRFEVRFLQPAAPFVRLAAHADKAAAR